MDGSDLRRSRAAVSKFDSHLTVGLGRSGGGETTLRIGLGATGMPQPLPTSGGFGFGGAMPQVATPNPPGVYSVGNGVSRPEVIAKVDPEYSEEARAAKYSGSVMLSVVINPDGKAENIQIVKPLGMGLDEKAIEAVEKWRFKPGMNNGVPVNVRAQIEVNFRTLDKP